MRLWAFLLGWAEAYGKLNRKISLNIYVKTSKVAKMEAFQLHFILQLRLVSWKLFPSENLANICANFSEC